MNINDELKIYELSLIWKEAEYNFAFWEKLAGTLDWDKAYKKTLTSILNTKTLRDYYLELMKFVALLRDGHTSVSLPESLSDEYSASLPIKLKYLQGKHVISNIETALKTKILRFSEITKINGTEINSYIKDNIFPYIWHEKYDSSFEMIGKFITHGKEGSELNLTISIDGAEKDLILQRKKNIVWSYEENLKADESFEIVFQSDTHTIKKTNNDVAVITIPSMENDKLSTEFYANLPLLINMKGFIIDIRNNGGGNSSNSDAIAKAFIDGEFQTSRDLKPIHIGTYKAWAQFWPRISYEEAVLEFKDAELLEKIYKIPKHMYYEESASVANHDDCPLLLRQPLIILSSCYTGSAAEDFLVTMDNAKRATIIGTASYGSTGQPLIINLESGGLVRICTRNCTYPDGRTFIDTGVIPHIPYDMLIEDYKQGIDSVMNKGLLEIRKLIKDNNKKQ